MINTKLAKMLLALSFIAGTVGLQGQAQPPNGGGDAVRPPNRCASCHQSCPTGAEGATSEQIATCHQACLSDCSRNF